MRNGRARGQGYRASGVGGQGAARLAGARFTSNVHRQIGLPSLLAEVARGGGGRTARGWKPRCSITTRLSASPRPA